MNPPTQPLLAENYKLSASMQLPDVAIACVN